MTNRNTALIDTFQRPGEPFGGLEASILLCRISRGQALGVNPRGSFRSLTRAERSSASLGNERIPCLSVSLDQLRGALGRLLPGTSVALQIQREERLMFVTFTTE
jgi:hypothetical protein